MIKSKKFLLAMSISLLSYSAYANNWSPWGSNYNYIPFNGNNSFIPFPSNTNFNPFNNTPNQLFGINTRNMQSKPNNSSNFGPFNGGHNWNNVNFNVLGK